MIRGGGGDDRIYDGRGPDRNYGGLGDDEIVGGLPGDIIHGNAGDDDIDWMFGGDVSCGSGSDVLSSPRSGFLIPGDCERIAPLGGDTVAPPALVPAGLAIALASACDTLPCPVTVRARIGSHLLGAVHVTLHQGHTPRRIVLPITDGQRRRLGRRPLTLFVLADDLQRGPFTTRFRVRVR